MKKTFFILLSTLVLIIIIVRVSNQQSDSSNKVITTQEPKSTPKVWWCDNDDEAGTFEKPIPIVWTAKMDGCLVSCQGASFTKISKNEKYPRFAGYYPDTSGNYNPDDWNPIPEMFQKEGLILRVTGVWIGIEDDHPVTVFDNKCVPIVNITKLGIVK